jgi:MYXO-CTERM domain-containing protein
VILNDPAGPVSDVFRIFNNLVNTGAGTGLGNMVFLYSSDDGTPLPDPSTYSANAVFMVETPPVTAFVGNGTNYLLGVPEPGTQGLFAVGVLALAVARRTRRRS